MKKHEELLPLYLNGQLEGSQRQLIQDALASDPELALEAEFLRTLKQGIQRNGGAPPVELGLARLKREIRQEDDSSPAPSSRTMPAPFWKGLALAACLLVTIQTGFMLFTTSGETRWELQSGSPAPDALQLQVVFAADATLKQLEEILQSHSARIIDGPGALGIYTLQLPRASDAVSVGKRLAESELVEEVSLP